jgi:hypothetical protein
MPSSPGFRFLLSRPTYRFELHFKFLAIRGWENQQGFKSQLYTKESIPKTRIHVEGHGHKNLGLNS